MLCILKHYRGRVDKGSYVLIFYSINSSLKFELSPLFY
jgi:hypothetical protein